MTCREIAWLSAALAMAAACERPTTAAGSFEVEFVWGDLTPPGIAPELWVWAWVEERNPATPYATGEVLRDASYETWNPNGTDLDLTGVPNGKNRVVIVEFRSAGDSDRHVQPWYYGQSDFFELAPAKHVVVPVLVSLTVGSYDLGAAVDIDGAVAGDAGQLYVNTDKVDLLIKPVDDAEIRVANDANMLSGLQLASEHETSISGPDGSGRLRWSGWDLNAGICGGDLPECADGGRSVYVIYVDKFGNRGPRHATRVSLDRTPPEVAAVVLRRDPVFGSSVDTEANVVSFSAEDPYTKQPVTATLLVFANEELATVPAPVVTVSAPGTIPFGLASVIANAATFVCPASGDPTEPCAAGPDGDYTFNVTWSDWLGNETTVPLDKVFRLDTTTPVLSVDQGQVTYVRSPWGNDSTEDLGSFMIPAGPYFALAPPEPLADAETLPGTTFQIDASGAPGALPVQLRIWADPAPASLLGEAYPTADGTWPRLLLAKLDTPVIYATALDRAGNESVPVRIENAEWIGTTNPPGFGQSPHLLEATSYARGARDPDPPLTTPAGTEAKGSDGVAVIARAEIAWRERQGESGPSARSGHAMAYDSARGRVVLFGGKDDSGNPMDDLWEWDGSDWLGPFSPTIRPSARCGHAMVYDSVRGFVVLFGGLLTASALPMESDLADDVWEWDGSNWSGPFAPAARPSARFSHAMAYDPVQARVVLFGGSGGVPKDDLWEWDGSAWSGPVEPATATRPSARYSHAMAYDSARGRVVLVGGTADGITPKDDLWEWDGTNWSGPIAPGVAGVNRPSARCGHAMVYESSAASLRIVLFGGSSDCGGASPMDDLWEWDGSTWYGPLVPGVPTARPSARRGHAMAYDSARGRVVLFAGAGMDMAPPPPPRDLPFNDLWEWDEDRGAWLGPVVPATRPKARFGHAMAYDSGWGRGRAVLFGGSEDTAGSRLLADLWEWDGGTWSERVPSGTRPSARFGHAMVYDSDRNRVMLFGGQDASGPKNDLWEWDAVGGTWSGPVVAPPLLRARYEHAMVYDSGRHCVVLFGGYGPSGMMDDLWEWNGTAWSGPVLPATRPSARFRHAMVYDNARSRVVLFGGLQGDGTPKNDLWEWDGIAWSKPVEPVTRPGTQYDHAMAYDSARGRVVLLGGITYGVLANDLWEWDGAGGVWLGPFAPPTWPGRRTEHAMVYDNLRDRLVLFGGSTGGVNPDNELWEGDSSVLRAPAIQFTAGYSSAGFSRQVVEELRVRARCGGRYSPYGDPASIGAVLSGWNTGELGASPGEWRDLGYSSAGVSSQQPYLPLRIEALIDWTEANPNTAQRYMVDGPKTMSFRCTPNGSSGAGAAEVALDYIEVRVRYKAP